MTGTREDAFVARLHALFLLAKVDPMNPQPAGAIGPNHTQPLG